VLRENDSLLKVCWCIQALLLWPLTQVQQVWIVFHFALFSQVIFYSAAEWHTFDFRGLISSYRLLCILHKSWTNQGCIAQLQASIDKFAIFLNTSQCQIIIAISLRRALDFISCREFITRHHIIFLVLVLRLVLRTRFMDADFILGFQDWFGHESQNALTLKILPLLSHSRDSKWQSNSRVCCSSCQFLYQRVTFSLS